MREHPRQHYEQVAEVYDEALEEGDPPTQAVAEAFDVPYTTAARWVRRTRALGLLPEPTPGLPRGNASPADAPPADSSPISTRTGRVEIPVDNGRALND